MSQYVRNTMRKIYKRISNDKKKKRNNKTIQIKNKKSNKFL